MKPEVLGALSLACRYCRPPRGKCKWQRDASRQKDMRKVQKHLARAIRFDKGP